MMNIPRNPIASSSYVVTLLILLVSGCEQTILKPTVPFNPQEMKNALRAGNSAIVGQAFAKTQGGDVKYGAGNTILLIPLTSYVEQALVLNNKAGAFTKVDLDPRIVDYSKSVVADGTGHFKFTHLAPGRYYIETDIKWQFPTQYGLQETGGIVKGVANIENDGTIVEIILQ
jgi:hypothetical protein